MKRNDIIFLLISTLIMSIAWIIFSIIHAATTSTIGTILNQQIESIAPNFDTNTITILTNRQKVIPLYTFSASASALTIPSNTPTPAQTISVNSSPSLSLPPSPIASQGGIKQ